MNCRNNNHYYAYVLIITKLLTYDNENLTKCTEFIHNRIMLPLKSILNQMTPEADTKDC
jgi:hypothetical protein